VIINSSKRLYNSAPDPQINVSLHVAGDLAPRVRNARTIDLRMKIGGDLIPQIRLSLSDPEPILNEIAPDAFQYRFTAWRLIKNGAGEVPISGFTIQGAKGFIGKTVNFELADKNPVWIDREATYTFEFAKYNKLSEPRIWNQLFSNLKIESGNLSFARLNDSLSFGALEPLADKLSRFPSETKIFYDPSKTSVDLTSLEKLYDAEGVVIPVTATAKSGLSLYSLFDYLKQKLGFSGVETNVPNYPLTRADFSESQSYAGAIAPFVGVFEPVFFTVGNVLWILDKTAAIPEDFTPSAVTADNFLNWSEQFSGQMLDGLTLVYIDSNSADFYVDRIVQTTDETGAFGAANFTRTETARTFRDHKHTDNPNIVLRTELIKEVVSVYNSSLELIGRETRNNTFDAQGKPTNASVKIESKTPNLTLNGTPFLQTVKEENQSIFYVSDSKNPRRQMQSKIVTQTRGMIALDEVNEYLNEIFKQDFIEAHKAGNLTTDMTVEFGLIKTVTETLTPLGNNQFVVRTQTIDHLRGAVTRSESEPRTGDASLNGIGGKQKQLRIWAEGITQATRTGKPIESFNVGELPLKFAKPLAERRLAARNARKASGTISIAGFDESVERGVFFRVLDCQGNSRGVFLAEGYSVQGTQLGTPEQRVTTSVEVAQI
jgi:hypothetical protein